MGAAARPALRALLALAAVCAAGCRPPALVPQRALERLGPPLAAPAAASEPKAEEGKLTEEAAVALALARNPSLAPYEAARDVARGEMRAATQVENPSVQLARIDFNLPIQQGWQVGLRWSPPRPWVMLGHYAQAKDQLAEADQLVAERRVSLTADVRAEHVRLLALEEELAVAAAAVEQRRKLAEAIGNRVERGAGTRLDLLAAQAALAQAGAELAELTEARQVGLERLRALLNLAPGEPLAVRGSLDTGAPGCDVPSLERRALDARPKLKALEARYARQTEAVSLARLERLPWFRLAAAPRWSWQPVLDRTELTVGLELFFPVWNWNLGKIDTEQAKLRQQGSEYEAELAQLRRDLAVGCRQLVTRRELLQVYDGSVLPTLQARVAAANQALQGAQLDVVALFTAEDALLAARRARVHARRDLRLALIDLERTMGEPLGGAP